MRIAVAAFATALVLAAADGHAQVPLQPGEYVTEDGWGNLTLTRGPAGALLFSIEATGTNGHSCDLDGEIRNGKATLEAFEKEDPCVVSFTAKGADIDVSINRSSDACRAFCGARAGFDGLYLKPAAGCAPSAIEKTRARFRQLYEKKSYADARATLQPVLDHCERTLLWLQAGSIRNDLAVTLYHLGDRAACRAVLEPLADHAAMSDAEVSEEFPPTDAESYLPIVKAARTNLRLCRDR